MNSVASTFAAPQEVVFDFTGAKQIDNVMANLSGVAVDGTMAWTVSDEGRTLECLAATDSGFTLRKQFDLDDFFSDLPSGKEADLESIDIADGRIWICGSHCRVRLEPETPGVLNSGTRARPSRHLLGSIGIRPSGAPIDGSAAALPFQGEGSLRHDLSANSYLSPFLELPSKENGLDIEGVAVLTDRVLLGLRGPVIDSHAVVVSLRRGASLPSLDDTAALHLLDLEGLGIRDLCRDDTDILILAGPVTAADGPFRIYRWQPSTSESTETAQVLHQWGLGHEHPEGLCPFARGARAGLLVVYDSPDGHRLSGATVTADWFRWQN